MAMASMRNFVNLHPGYNTIAWSESDRRSPQQTNNYDCGVWAVLNVWAWMERGNTPVDVGLTDRVHIGRTIASAAQAVDQRPLPQSTDEVEYMGTRNLRVLTPAKTPAPRTPSPAPRLREMVSLSPETQEIISTAQQTLSNLNISRGPSPMSFQSVSREQTPGRERILTQGSTPNRSQPPSRGQNPSGFQTPVQAQPPSRNQTPSNVQSPSRGQTPTAASRTSSPLSSVRGSVIGDEPLISTRRSPSVVATQPSTPARPTGQPQQGPQSGSQQGQYSTRTTRSRREF